MVYPYCSFHGLIKTMRKALLDLFKVQIASARWGTLNSKDLELIEASSWIMVMRANYIQSSTMSTAVTTTLDRMMDGSSTWESIRNVLERCR